MRSEQYEFSDAAQSQFSHLVRTLRLPFNLMNEEMILSYFMPLPDECKFESIEHMVFLADLFPIIDTEVPISEKSELEEVRKKIRELWITVNFSYTWSEQSDFFEFSYLFRALKTSFGLMNEKMIVSHFLTLTEEQRRKSIEHMAFIADLMFHAYDAEVQSSDEYVVEEVRKKFRELWILIA